MAREMIHLAKMNLGAHIERYVKAYVNMVVFPRGYDEMSSMKLEILSFAVEEWDFHARNHIHETTKSIDEYRFFLEALLNVRNMDLFKDVKAGFIRDDCRKGAICPCNYSDGEVSLLRGGIYDPTPLHPQMYIKHFDQLEYAESDEE